MSAAKKKGHKKSAFWLQHVGNVKRILDDEISITNYGESLDGMNIACEQIIAYFEQEAESLKVAGEADQRKKVVEEFQRGANFARTEILKRLEDFVLKT